MKGDHQGTSAERLRFKRLMSLQNQMRSVMAQASLSARAGPYLLPAPHPTSTVIPESRPSPSSRNSRSGYPGSTATQNTPNVSPKTSRTNQILTCNHPEYGTIYTNAASCEEADLHNRISVAEPLHQTPGQDQYSGEGYQTPENEAGNSRTNRKLIENE